MLGGEVCRQLSMAGKPVRALVRPTVGSSRLAEMQKAGYELVNGDLKDPVSLRAACRDAQAVVSTASSTFSRQPGDSIDAVDRVGQLSLVEAARSAGVQHFVYISFPPMAEDFFLQRAKREVEQAIVASGMTYTILQPTFFMEIWLGEKAGFDIAGRRVRIYGSGEKAISWISFTNVAEFAVRSLDNTAVRNATIPLGGPEALSQFDVVRIFEEMSGQAFTLDYLLESVLRNAKAAARRPLDEALAALSLACSAGQSIDMRATLEAMPVRLVGVREYAKWILSNDSASAEV